MHLPVLCTLWKMGGETIGILAELLGQLGRLPLPLSAYTNVPRAHPETNNFDGLRRACKTWEDSLSFIPGSAKRGPQVW